ncbi:MAG: hypothetical protein IBX55_01700 [Methyloprofundus sp.]|nr:hypothetical protein [Methyloprofundus sp.]
MNFASYTPVLNSGAYDFVPDTRPACSMTPLYSEVARTLTSAKSGMTIDEVAKRVKTTKHHSRVRLALDALVKMGLVCRSEDNASLKYRLAEA